MTETARARDRAKEDELRRRKEEVERNKRAEEQERMRRRKSAMERGGAFMCARVCVYTLYRKRE